MSKNVAYVREKRIATLLNDMVVHLLASQPSDVLGSLIGYLEKHSDASAAKPFTPAPPAKEQPKDKAARPHPQAEPSSAATSPAAADKEKSAAPAAEPAAEAKPQAATAAVAAHVDAAKEIEEPKEQAKKEPENVAPVDPQAVQDVLSALQASESELADLLAAVLADETLGQEERSVASQASAAVAEMRLFTDYADKAHTRVGVALDRVRSTMTDGEYYASTGFRLIHELESNELLARKVMDELGVDFFSLSAEDRGHVSRAFLAHEDMLKLIEDIETHQLSIAVAANKGAVNRSVVAYFDDLTAKISSTYQDLKGNMASLENQIPSTASAPKTQRKLEDMTLEEQTDYLIAAIAKEQEALNAAITALEGGNDAELAAVIADAIKAATEMGTLTGIAAENNINASTGDTKSYNDTRKQLRQLNSEIAMKIMLFRKSHCHALSRITSAVAQGAVEAAKKSGVELATLLKDSSEPEAKQALDFQAEVEKLLAEVANVQSTVRRHAIGH